MLLSTDQRRALRRHAAGWIATGFGSGLSPVAPGTAGSLVALLPWLALRELPPLYYSTAVLIAFAIGVWACSWIVRGLRVSDPSIAVWDEFVGIWIALAPLVFAPASAWWIFVGFILFRIFDIWKPFPVSWADREVAGGFGVMLDDAIAGVYAAILLALMIRFI